MSKEAQLYYAKKFFSDSGLTLRYVIATIQASLTARGIPFEHFSV